MAELTKPSQDQILALLKTISAFKSWPARDLEQLAGQAVAINVDADEPVFEASHQSDDAYIVYTGAVRQSVTSVDGKIWWSRSLHVGELFAQQALFRGASYASAAVAEADSLLLLIKASTLAELLIKHPDLWSIFYNNTARRLQAIPLLRALDDDQITHLSVATVERTYKAGEKICHKDDPAGSVYLINWGQVRITEQAQTEMISGRLEATAPTAELISQQGFIPLPHLITAGNYFVGGLMRIPHQLTVSAEAATDTTLIMLDGATLEQLEQSTQDVQFLLRNRLNISARLQEALGQEPLFRDLKPEHWVSLASVTGWEHVPSNLDVTRQGQIGSKLYVLAAGAATMRSTDDAGRERPRHVSHVGDKDFYGVNALLHGDRHDATVRSEVDNGPLGTPLDGTDWLTLQHDDVLYLLQADYSLWHGTTLWRELQEKPKETQRYNWQETDETIELFQRKHIIWLLQRLGGLFLVAYGFLGLLTAADSVMQGNLNPWTYALLTLVVLALPATWFVIDYLNDYYIITNKRVLDHERVLMIYENQITAPIERIQDVTSRASFIGRLLNYAHLDISTAGLGVISFEMIPNPDRMISTIRALQGRVRTGTAAEQRENLRNKILSDLKMRMIPDIPKRVLPDALKYRAPLNSLQRFWQSLTNPFRRFNKWLRSRPEKIYLGMLGLLPKDMRTRILQDREKKKKAKASARPTDVDIVYRKHPWFLLKATAIPLAIILGSAALFLFAEFNLRTLSEIGQPAVIGYVVFLLLCFFWLWYQVDNWRNDMYILSKTHITDVYRLPLGLFERRRQAEWEKVQNANYVVPGLWANLANFGTVIVETASVEGKFEFINVGNPRKVQREIMNRIGITRAAQAQRAREQQQSTLSETLEIYNELIQDWTMRNQRVGAPPPPGAQPPANGHSQL